MSSKMRLDKYLSKALGLSRSAVKEYLQKGTVTVNGQTEKKGAAAVLPDTDLVAVSGKPLCYQEFCYLMLHKPAGYVSATTDQRERTVMELLPPSLKRPGLFIAGRLDKDTEGFLLLTNDGPFAHDILSPKKHVPKTYYAEIDGVVTQEDAALFAEGLLLPDGSRLRPARLEILESAQTSRVRLVICEGKFHQVKRMFSSLQKPVLYLKRIQIGGLLLDPALPLGACRELSPEELLKLGSGFLEVSS